MFLAFVDSKHRRCCSRSLSRFHFNSPSPFLYPRFNLPTQVATGQTETLTICKDENVTSTVTMFANRFMMKELHRAPLLEMVLAEVDAKTKEMSMEWWPSPASVIQQSCIASGYVLSYACFVCSHSQAHAVRCQVFDVQNKCMWYSHDTYLMLDCFTIFRKKKVLLMCDILIVSLYFIQY